MARAQGALSEERLQVLYAMGFEFGEVAQLTEEWEAKFDQLIEWLLWQVWGCSLLPSDSMQHGVSSHLCDAKFN